MYVSSMCFSLVYLENWKSQDSNYIPIIYIIILYSLLIIYYYNTYIVIYNYYLYNIPIFKKFTFCYEIFSI